MQKNKEKRQTLTLFLDKCDYSGELAPYKIKHRERKTDKQKLFALYFEKAKEKGKLPPNADTAILSLAFNSYLKGLVLEYLEKPADFHIEENATRLMKLFFTQLSAKETWS